MMLGRNLDEVQKTLKERVEYLARKLDETGVHMDALSRELSVLTQSINQLNASMQKR